MVLEVVVKSKKMFVAAANIKLEQELLDKEIWFPLGNCANWLQQEPLCRPVPAEDAAGFSWAEGLGTLAHMYLSDAY